MNEQGVLWMPSNSYFPGRDGHSPRWIIIHGTAGFISVEEVGYFFQKVPSSTHYTIGCQGEILQSVSEQDSAWGNGGISEGRDPWWSPDINPNYVTISIEHVKAHRDNSDMLTEIQATTSFRLIQHICDRHGIPKRKADADGGITGHFSMDPVNRCFCPGPYPWDELFTFLAQPGNMLRA